MEHLPLRRRYVDRRQAARRIGGKRCVERLVPPDQMRADIVGARR